MPWYQLVDIMHEQQQDEMMPGTGREGPPLACPIDGTPLEPGDPMDSSVVLFCPFDGWQYPRDWERPASNYGRS